MGSFGTSDLWDLSAPPRGQPLVSWDGARASSLTADLLTLARQNADALQAILGAQVLGEPRYLYLPAGGTVQLRGWPRAEMRRASRPGSSLLSRSSLCEKRHPRGAARA